MKARIAALLAAASAAAATAGAAVWARRKTAEDEAHERELLETLEVEAIAESEMATIAVEPGPVRETPRPGSQDDDLTVIKGVGTVSAERLAGVGITTLAQLAAWSDADLDDYAARIKVSPERIRREDWVGQARALVED